MDTYSRSHLSDGTLLSNLRARVAQHCKTTAEMLADLAEVDERRLYVPAGFPSMFAYCLEELHFSEDVTSKRIQAARTARSYPAIFSQVAEGRLHASGICLLAPHLKPENADELLAAAAHLSCRRVEQLLADRFPQPDVPTLIRALPEASENCQHAARHVEVPAQAIATASPPSQLAPKHVLPAAPPPKVAPLAPRRYSLQLTMSQDMHDDLRRAQELLSHAIPSGDVAQVLHRALQALIQRQEKRKFGAAAKPRSVATRSEAGSRYIPPSVKRAVWRRDGGCCTFVSKEGRRCQSRKFLEYDHAHEFARGGQATVSNLRLRCRTHNRYAAECSYGIEFMRQF